MNNLENKFYIHEVFLKLVFSLFNKEEYILSEQVQEIDCWTFFLMEFGIILCQGVSRLHPNTFSSSCNDCEPELDFLFTCRQVAIADQPTPGLPGLCLSDSQVRGEQGAGPPTRGRRDACGGRKQQRLCFGCPSPQAEAQGSQFIYPAHQQYRGEAARHPERRHAGGTGEGHTHPCFKKKRLSHSHTSTL